MAKLILILSAVMALQLCVSAAPNTDDRPISTAEESPKIENADLKLDSEPNEISDIAKVDNNRNPQGQRQKRFNDFFDFGFSFYDQYNPYSIKRDDSQNTGVYGAQDTLSQIYRRLQTILNYTRRQSLSPPIAHYPVSYIPFIYIPHGDCSCTPGTTPSDGGSGNDARPTQPTATTPPADRTTQQTSPANEPDTPPTDDTNEPTPDLPSRLPDIYEEEDGSRPISFIPIKPKTPLSRPAPPVEHGSSQAGLGNKVEAATVQEAAPPITTFRPMIAALPPQAHLPTNSIPTLCDGAVLTCCHRAEVTYDCFLSQGCPNPTSPDNPCEENLVLNIISKFQYYYANRRLQN